MALEPAPAARAEEAGSTDELSGRFTVGRVVEASGLGFSPRSALAGPVWSVALAPSA